MSTLEPSAKYLSEKGLVVRVHSSHSLHVHREGDRVINIAGSDGSGHRLHSWEHTPGPGEEDFDFIVANLDQTLLIVWCYYFAKDIEISGWRLPIHRRPYWELPKLQYRLETAARISGPQFDRIREERRQRALADPAESGIGLAFAERTQFIFAGVHAESGNRLFLRRDMEESYIVSHA